MTKTISIWEKLESDEPHFRSLARHARENKRYAEANHLNDMADYVKILYRYKEILT